MQHSSSATICSTLKKTNKTRSYCYLVEIVDSQMQHRIRVCMSMKSQEHQSKPLVAYVFLQTNWLPYFSRSFCREKTIISHDVASDPTLPRTNAKCPRCSNREAVFFQSASSRYAQLPSFFFGLFLKPVILLYCSTSVTIFSSFLMYFYIHSRQA